MPAAVLPAPEPAIPDIARLLLEIDTVTTWVLLAGVYLLVALTVWAVLWGRHPGLNLAMWCSGSALAGLALLSFVVRDRMAPDDQLPLIVAGNGVVYLSFVLRWGAMRRERGRAMHLRMALAGAALAAALLPLVDAWGDQPRSVCHQLLLLVGALAIATEAIRLARERDSRSAALIGWAYGLLAGAVSLRAATLALGLSPPLAVPTSAALDALTLVVSGLLAAVWGNIGYLGFAMEMVQRRESARTAELAAATARSEQAERQAAELKALSDERQELLRVISHEVRQPLHNAQAVLQGVDRALQAVAQTGDDAASRADDATARTGRARSVLAQITGGLDNILAASTLLVTGRPGALRDADLDMLLQLALGDLPEAGRPRVRIERASAVRTAAMDVALMRLALRNLLANALAYATPGTPITLRVTDGDDDALALVFEVEDAGPGIPPALLPRIFERGARGRTDLPGQGLGLYIVRLAMQRQGGTVSVRSTPAGSVFTLVLPQGQEP